MFVEKINHKDFEKFFSDKAGIEISTKTSKDGSIYAKFLMCFYDITPEYILKDFSCEPLNVFAKMNSNEMMRFWKMYLVDVFGENYLTAYNNHLEKENKK